MSLEIDYTLETAERRAIVRALRISEGNKLRAAEMLGVSRSTLYRKLERHKLDADDFVPSKD